jgi:hypothetical protein
LREECRLREFENRVLRRIFRPKRDEVIGEWRKLHEQELHKIKKNEMGGACSSDWGGQRCVQGLWWENLRERDRDPGIDGRIILR